MAVQARVPVIPVFTQNIREAFRTVQLGRSFFRKIYDKYKFPMMAIYGGFPVKLKTIIGKPIYLNHQLSAEDIASQVRNAFGSTCQFLIAHSRVFSMISLYLYKFCMFTTCFTHLTFERVLIVCLPTNSFRY